MISMSPSSSQFKHRLFIVLLLVGLLSVGLSAFTPEQAFAGTWKKNSTGWWYKNDNGSYPQSSWESIDGYWYYFNDKGYMKTGWLKDGSDWYYLNPSGEMATGWKYSGGKWYYLNSNGTMATGWVSSSGYWYFLNDGGAMQTGWVKDGGEWYFLDSSGAMLTDWFKTGGKWYYANSSGIMQASKWISGSYYVGSNGAMLANTWTPDGYWVNGSGLYTDDGQVEAILNYAAEQANTYDSTADKLNYVAQVVYYYACNSTYGSNSSGTYAKPYGLIIDRQFTCAGTASMCAEILYRMGYGNVVHTNKNQYTHQWTEVKAGGEWWIVEGYMGFATKKSDAPNYPNGSVKMPNGMVMHMVGA